MFLTFLSLIKETKYKHRLQKFEKYGTAHINEIVLYVRSFNHSDGVKLVLRPYNFFPSSGFISKAHNVERCFMGMKLCLWSSVVVLPSQPNSEKVIKE